MDGSITVGYDNFENYIIGDGEVGYGERDVMEFSSLKELLEQYSITSQYDIN